MNKLDSEVRAATQAEIARLVLTRDSRLPESLPFADTFKRVLLRVVEEGYARLEDWDDEEDKEGFDSDLANALSETLALLGYDEAETGDWLGDLYDLAEEAGIAWQQEEDDNDDPS